MSSATLPRLPDPAAALALALGAVSIIAAGLAAGISLGFVLGGFFAVAIGLPPLLAAEPSFRGRLRIAAALLTPVACGWLILISPSRATVDQWAILLLLIGALAILLAGSVAVLRRLSMTAELAAAVTVFFALAWLTWPVWLSPYIARGGSPGLVNALVLIHPPLVANGVLTFTPPWTEQAMAYQLTALDQDLAIKLPTNPLPCILVHAAAGALLLGIAKARRP